MPSAWDLARRLPSSRSALSGTGAYPDSLPQPPSRPLAGTLRRVARRIALLALLALFIMSVVLVIMSFVFLGVESEESHLLLGIGMLVVAVVSAARRRFLAERLRSPELVWFAVALFAAVGVLQLLQAFNP
jgi:chromate transport protein ChrA